MQLGFGAGDAVVLIGIVERLELFAGVDQRFLEHYRVLEVHVIIAGAVNIQKMALQILGEANGTRQKIRQEMTAKYQVEF